MLTNNGIIFFDLHFFSHCPLVFGCGVVVTSTCGRYEFDLVSHYTVSFMVAQYGPEFLVAPGPLAPYLFAVLGLPLLDLLSATAQITQHGIDTFLVNDSHTLR